MKDFMKSKDQLHDIGVIGLAVMGQNLVLNFNDKGYSVVVHDRTVSKINEFLNGSAKGRNEITGAKRIEEMIPMLKRPRRIMLMVKAGEVVDGVIHELRPFLEPGDVMIDGGNSYFTDTIRRTRELDSKGILS